MLCWKTTKNLKAPHPAEKAPGPAEKTFKQRRKNTMGKKYLGGKKITWGPATAMWRPRLCRRSHVPGRGRLAAWVAEPRIPSRGGPRLHRAGPSPHVPSLSAPALVPVGPARPALPGSGSPAHER